MSYMVTEAKSGSRLQDSRIIYGSVTVPVDMIGCWNRCGFRVSGRGEVNDVSAIWIQTLSGVADIRIANARPALAERSGFADCSTDELLALAEQDCFCGITRFDPLATPWPTADWPTESYLFRFQPVITFPEPGWIEWRDAGTCMIERAPSGAYEEDWRVQPNSRDFALHMRERASGPRTQAYICGAHAIYARNRAVDLPADKTLLELASEAGYDRRFLEDILDCEFSYAFSPRPGEDYTIVASTLPWREGKALGWGELRESCLAARDIVDLRPGDEWAVESFWLA
jgi:hypothetical protein